MWFGIMIGMMIGGLAVAIGNAPLSRIEAATQPVVMLLTRGIVYCCAVVVTAIGFCGAIGWLIEVML